MNGAVALALALLMSSAPAVAETVERREPFDPAQFRQQVHHALNLTDRQKARLQELRLQLQEQLVEVRAQVEDGMLSENEGRIHFRQALRAHRSERNLLLSHEQTAFLERARQFIEQRQISGQPGGPGHRQTPNLAEDLQLSDEQKRLWRELLLQQRHQMRSLSADGFAPSREDVARMRVEHRQVFETLLTQPQLTKLAEIRTAWHDGDATDEAEAGLETEEFGDFPAGAVDEGWEDLLLDDESEAGSESGSLETDEPLQ